MGKVAVVVVHGIGSGTGEERCAFSESLKKNVKMLLPAGEDPVWEETNWEKLNDDIDAIIERVLNGICKRYIDATKKVLVQQELREKASPYKVSKCCIMRWVAAFCSWVRKFELKVKLMVIESADKYLPGIIDAAIDLPLYMQEPKGDEIRTVVRKAIARAKERADKVVLVGHSLGSVVAFDVAAEELAKKDDGRLAALVTMGSPLSWVAEIRKVGSNGWKHMRCTRSLPWINFWDPADPVPEHKELDDKVFPGVKNVKVESGLEHIHAHCAYWSDREVARRIERMLKGDFSVD